MIDKIDEAKKVMPTQSDIPEIKVFDNELTFNRDLHWFIIDFLKHGNEQPPGPSPYDDLVLEPDL